MSKEKTSESKKLVNQGPSLERGSNGPDKEIKRALEKEEEIENKGIKDTEKFHFSGSARRIRKNLRKWKRRVRTDLGKGSLKRNNDISMSNEKRKLEDSIQEMVNVTTKQCIPYFEVNEGILAKAENQPHRTP